MTVIDWLLEGDPAIRWQVMRDLTDAPAETVEAERAKVATAGWGAALLATQKPQGHWGEPGYTSWLDTPDGSATCALMLLKDMGAAPRSPEVRRAVVRIRDNVTHYEGGKPFFQGETEACINGRVLSLGACFGEPDEALLERLLSEQLDDGGWNCEAPQSRRSSFHSTICVLEGLFEYERAAGGGAAIRAARRRGEDYLLARGMLRRLSSGEVIDPAWTRFSFPCGYHYDVLRGLDYLRTAGSRPDERIAEAVDLVTAAGLDDGRWPLQTIHGDRFAFDMGEDEGRPSRWITLRGLRVLKWAGRSG